MCPLLCNTLVRAALPVVAEVNLCPICRPVTSVRPKSTLVISKGLNCDFAHSPYESVSS